MITTATLLIGYYHDLLLRNIDIDLLADKMCSVRLLTTHDSIISFDHSSHHRNWTLLEQVRHFDVHALIMFCELVQEIWPQVGSQLITGIYIYVYVRALQYFEIYYYFVYNAINFGLSLL